MTRRNDKGFVLVCVLWILALLTVMAIGFGRRSMLERQASTYVFNHTQAMYMARGAIARGMVELRNKAIYDMINQEPGRTSYAQQWAKPMDLLQDPCYQEEGTEGTAAPSTDEEGGDNKDVCTFTIRDESSRICINAADKSFLENIESLDRSILRKIDIRRMGGGDTGDPPQPFQTIEELRFLDDKISDKEWFGDEDTPGLKDLLTCWGDGQVNINTASAEVLNCIPDADEGIVGAIDAFRKGGDGILGTEDDQDFKDWADLTAKAGLGGDSLAALQQYCKFDSQVFTITGIATQRNGKIVATCVATVVVADGMAGVIKWREEIVES